MGMDDGTMRGEACGAVTVVEVVLARGGRWLRW